MGRCDVPVLPRILESQRLIDRERSSQGSFLWARDDLDPSVRANLVQTLADVSLVAHDFALDYEMLYDLGV